MTKKKWPILIFLCLLAACSSSKLLQKQRYDDAINKAVKKLVKDPTDGDEIAVLKEAYRIANGRDNDRINYLKKTGEEANWDDIHRLYKKMKYRQNQVLRVNAYVQQSIGFEKVDYDRKIIESKEKAAEYHYNKALDYLNAGDRFSARDALYSCQKVKSYYVDYKDVESLMLEAQAKGITHVLFEMKNITGIGLPRNFTDEMMKISLSDLDSKWVHYDTRKTNSNYHYTILLHIRSIEVSPEFVKERELEETKEVQDGWQYVLDEKGNVKKDTAGNDIKVPKYKTLKCFLVETNLHKTAKVSGTIDFIDDLTGQLIKNEPITVETGFTYTFAEAFGDLEAMSETSRKLVRNKPIPFPQDLDMIFDTNEQLKRIAKDIISKNRRIIK